MWSKFSPISRLKSLHHIFGIPTIRRRTTAYSLSTVHQSPLFRIRNETASSLPSSSRRSSMAKSFIAAAAVLLSLFALSSSVSTPNAAHTILISYNFPPGLLPTTIHSYTINTTTGDFSLRLGSLCHVTLPPDNYLAAYSDIIKGRIVENRIEKLDGIRVRALWKWWGITGIKREGEDLVFEVGVVSAKYPVGKFEESPECEGVGKKDE
ncbi:hypothetical protein Droror1_Dr00015765 [Drosera rotundifolia]